MKISELPSEIKEKAIAYRKEYCNPDTEDCLHAAFSWQETDEGYNFWNRLHLANAKHV